MAAQSWMLLLLITMFITAVASSDNWGYSPSEGHHGPLNWMDVYPTCVRDNLQSPINLELFKAAADPQLIPIAFANYDTLPPNQTWTVQNNGHTVLLSAPYPCKPHIQDGKLGGSYDVEQIHFHWGEEDFRGSEHHVDGRQYPLEMHIVHFRRGDPSSRLSKEPAETQPLRIAVIGVFFELVANDNEYLKPFTDVLSQVEDPTNASGAIEVLLEGFNLKPLIPASPDFFRYRGSLTTPPCDPVVLWSVFRQASPISLRQLQAFRKLNAPDDPTEPASQPVNGTIKLRTHHLADNFRPLQPLANRTVHLYTQSKLDVNSNIRMDDVESNSPGVTKTSPAGSSASGLYVFSLWTILLVTANLLLGFRSEKS